jgi:hypothetical protein
MNVWHCDYPRCISSASGTGEAIGLRAIGWWFIPGDRTVPEIFCPAHRPDRTCDHGVCPGGDACPGYTGHREATAWQTLMKEGPAHFGSAHEHWRTEALQALLKVMEEEARAATIGSGEVEGLMVGIRGLRAILADPQKAE